MAPLPFEDIGFEGICVDGAPCGVLDGSLFGTKVGECGMFYSTASSLRLITAPVLKFIVNLSIIRSLSLLMNVRVNTYGNLISS